MRKEIARATTLYRSALSNCRTDEERYWVNYFYAAHLARTAGDIPEAINLAERTHAFFGRYDTALPLGNYYAWSGRFEEGEELIEWALQRAPTTMSERIATTSLVECFRQWSDADLAAGSPTPALIHALRGLQHGLELHDSGSTDEQLMQAIVRAAVAALKAVRQTALRPEDEGTLKAALHRLDGDSGFHGLPPWRQLEYAVSNLTDEMRSQVAPGLGPRPSTQCPRSGRVELSITWVKSTDSSPTQSFRRTCSFKPDGFVRQRRSTNNSRISGGVHAIKERQGARPGHGCGSDRAQHPEGASTPQFLHAGAIAE